MCAVDVPRAKRARRHSRYFRVSKTEDRKEDAYRRSGWVVFHCGGGDGLRGGRKIGGEEDDQWLRDLYERRAGEVDFSIFGNALVDRAPTVVMIVRGWFFG